MATDWIKSEDDQFNQQMATFHNWIATPANAAAASIGTGEVDALNNAHTNWSTTYSTKIAHDIAALPITAGKNTAREMLEAIARPLGKILRAKRQSGALTDAQIVAAGMPLTDTTQTPSTTPTTRPVLTLDASQRQRTEPSWRDETTPAKTARPADARTCEIRAIALPDGTMPPADPADWTYQATDPKAPHLIVWDIADLGKEGWVAARWIGYNNQPGPWSTSSRSTILR